MAPRTFHVLLTCLLCLLRTGNGQDDSTTITVTPATLTLMPNRSDGTGGQVTISCRASSVGTSDLLTVINIQRVLHASPNADPVLVISASLPDDTDAVLKLTSLQGSATVTGGLTDKTITLILNRANCGDAGMYICTAYSISGGVAKMYTSSRNLTVEVSPGSITMTTEPSGVTTHRVNDALLMRCNGIVGTVLDDSQLEWIWQYQDGNRFAGVENWQPYRDIGDNSADIQTDSSITTTNSCYNRQISVLTRHLTRDDTDREYRCYVINNGVSGSQNAQANAQVISVGTVSESGVAPATQSISSGSVTTTTVSTGTDKSKDDRLKTCDCPDVGVIIGAVVAVLIVIDVVILAVVIIVLKRRMMGSATQTMSEETRGKDNQMSSLGNVNRPVEQGPAEQRPVEQRPVEQRHTAAAEHPNTYDGLIMRDVGVASLYQDLGSPYELSR